MSKAISVSTGLILQICHQMEGICVNFLDQVQFSQFLKGRCHGNQFSGKNGAKLPTLCTYRSVSPKWNGYRYLNVRINSANDASISCKNFVNCGPVTPEKTGLVCVLFFTTWQKNWHI